MSFLLYVLGMLVVIGGLAWGASMAHVPGRWIAVGALVLLGIGITTGVSKPRHRDPPSP